MAGRKVVIHNRTSRAVRIRSNGVVFRRDGCFFRLHINGEQVACSQFIDQALEPLTNRQLAEQIKTIMGMEQVAVGDVTMVFPGFNIEYNNS